MKNVTCGRQYVAAMWLCVSGLTAAASSSNSHCWAQEETWIRLEKCAVVERKMEIPAQERGFIKTLRVELNQSVEAGQVLAELDTELAELELRMAQLEHAHARDIAADDADVRYQQVALEKVEEELSRYRAISTSVSESEIRRLTLGVEQARLGVVRATHAQARAIADEKLKAAAVEAARLRLARRQIIAPASGVVTDVKIHPGQAVEAGQTIMELQDLEHITVDRLVPLEQFQLAELVGAEVRIDAPRAGAGIRLSGEITSYDPRISPGGLVRIHARVKNVRHAQVWVLHPGGEVTMFVARSGGQGRPQAQASIEPQRLR